MGTIQVSGKAARKVECDLLEYTLTFTRTKGSVSLAIEAVEKDMEKTLEALKNFGVAIEHIHVEKDSVDEGYSQKDTAVFECERKVRFKIKANNAFTNRLMDILKNNQISAFVDTNYYYSEEQKLRKELLKEALLDSKSKAELLADANQQILQGIETIEESGRYENPVDFMSIGQAKYTERKSLSDQLGTKELNIEAEILVTWNIQ